MVDEATREVLFLYKKISCKFCFREKKTVAEGLWKKNNPEKKKDQEFIMNLNLGNKL